MSFAAPEERYNSYNSYRAHPAPPLSPDQRIHSSHGYPTKHSTTSPGQVYQDHPHALAVPSHGYPPQHQQQGQSQPMTPLTSSSYPPGQAGYYPIPGSAGTQGEAIPSPPPSSANPTTNNTGRPDTANSAGTAAGNGEFAAPAAPGQTGEGGVPIVPVGVSGGKLFRCRGYGECDKVFTRSEHLARHVRKHTGERPFPCHCGKAFSRLDNLRQHAATVHSEQTGLNETMLASLGPIHAALSQRASKDQRRRGEVVEVPKNAVERRQSEYRTRGGSTGSGQANHAGAGAAAGQGQGTGTAPTSATNSPYAQYHDPQSQWGGHSRPRTSGGYDYPYADPHAHQGMDDPTTTGGPGAGPSRRPGSAAGYYQQDFYAGANGGRPGSAAGGEMGLPYPYRPMSSQGRDLPVPTHYAESEPPTSAHGESPMYATVPNPHHPHAHHAHAHAHPHAAHHQQAPQAWSSPPNHHSAYPPHEHAAYPAPEGYGYQPHPQAPHAHPHASAHAHAQAGHGTYPPREDVYEYPPTSAGGWSGQYPPASNGASGAGGAGAGYAAGYGAQPDSPFQYNVGPAGADAYGAGAAGTAGGYERKRRAEDEELDNGRGKHARHLSSEDASSTAGGGGTAAENASAASLNAALEASTAPPPAPAPAPGPGPAPGAGRGNDSWLPPTTERRGSLAISALLGSPPKSVAELDAAAAAAAGLGGAGGGGDGGSLKEEDGKVDK